MADGCPKCRATKDAKGRWHHAASCPELRWPDGRLRGSIAAADLLPLPRLLNPDERAAKVFDNPGGLSPIFLTMSRIFAGHSEAMIARHIEDIRRQREGS